MAELRLQNVRCLHSAQLALHPRVNWITGDNGAGKTSLLEAVYLLGRGRSFRTRYVEQLITAVASRDGREVVRALEALRDKVHLDRDAEWRYLIK